MATSNLPPTTATRTTTSTDPSIQDRYQCVLDGFSKMANQVDCFMTQKHLNLVDQITNKFSNGVADYDGYALFQCLCQSGFFPLENTENQTGEDYQLFIENVVLKLVNDQSLEEPFVKYKKAFQVIGEMPIWVFHDMALDPNSDDFYALLIVRAIAKACQKPVNVNFVAVAGSNETRIMRAQYAHLTLTTSGKSIKGMSKKEEETLSIKHWYLPVGSNVKPLPFIKGVAMDAVLMTHPSILTPKALDITTKINGFVYFCGHLEKGESLQIIPSINMDGSVLMAQTSPNGNFNVPKNDPLLSVIEYMHVTPTTIPWSVVSTIIPPIVGIVNKTAKLIMLTTEMASYTKLSQSGSAQPKEGVEHLQLSSAYTRANVIDDGWGFYAELHGTMLDGNCE